MLVEKQFTKLLGVYEHSEIYICTNFKVTAKTNIKLSPFFLSVVNCTSLTVDPGSPLRMSSCDYHYGAQCNFSCAIGYRLNGSSTLTCVAPGNQHPGVWNNTMPRCGGKLKS